MKIGLLATSISRQAGGLLWTLRSLAQGLSDGGCRISVFAGEDNDTKTDLRHWRALDVTTVPRRGPAFFGYMPDLYSELCAAQLDLLHTQGLWMYPTIAALQLHKKQKRPLVISPQGMLDGWALRNSAWKKRVAGLCYENAHLRAAACMHALCPSEYESIRAYGLRNPIAIIPNAVDLPEEGHEPSEPNWADLVPSDAQVLLFLGRIHPKKGLCNLVRAWAKVRLEWPSAAERWQLIIAGWEQGGHQQKLEQLSATLGLHESVHFVGPQFDERKAASLHRADAFILPSFSEGLPIAVLEAWSYRLPVLQTPQCNLPEGFAAKAAIEMAPEAASIAAALKKLFDMPELERRAMGEKGRRLVEEQFTWPVVAASMRSVYEWVLCRGPMPACIASN